MSEEYLDLVNDQDQVIGRKLRSEIYQENIRNFRVVNAFLRNSEGKLWIPKRSLEKPLYPGALDMSMGGHVSSGESYDEAFKREIQEELNLDVRYFEWSLLGHLHPKIHNVSVFMKVYQIKTEQTPNYNPSEFIEANWLTPDDLLAQIERGVFAKSDLPILVRHFYAS